MPADPSEAADVARGMSSILAGAEARMLELVGATLTVGLDDPTWDQRALGRIQTLSVRLTDVAKSMDQQAEPEIQRAILDAWQAGADSASADLENLTTPRRQPARLRDAAMIATENLQATATKTIGQLSAQAAFRSGQIYEDTAKLIIAQGTVGAGVTRRDLTARFLQRLAARGIDGFVDARGRNWNMQSYGEMVTRTTTQQALVSGHIDQLQENGQDLVMVSDAPAECVMCRPFEGQILTISGKPGAREEYGERFTVVATVADARRRGLFHPNCRHRLVAFLPGITPRLVDTADPEGDALRQEQRARERAVRKAKRRQVAAEQATGKNSLAAKRARAVVAEKRADLSQLIRDNGLKDLAYRSRVDIGNVKVPPPKQPRIRPVPLELRTIDAELPPVQGPDPRPFIQPVAPIPDVQLPTRRRGKRTPPADVRERNAAELRDVSDDELNAAITASLEEDHPGLDRLIAEGDRREQAPFRAQANREKRRLATAAKREAVGQAQADKVAALINSGVDPYEAVEQVTGLSVRKQLETEAFYRLRAEGMPGKSFDEMAREAFKRDSYRRYIDAENATRGKMLNKAAEQRNARAFARGQDGPVDPFKLFSGNYNTARANASPELQEWWDDNGRPTFDEFKEQLVTGLMSKGDGSGEDFLR